MRASSLGHLRGRLTGDAAALAEFRRPFSIGAPHQFGGTSGGRKQPSRRPAAAWLAS